jgi:hypothetical protein
MAILRKEPVPLVVAMRLRDTFSSSHTTFLAQGLLRIRGPTVRNAT